MAYDKIPCNAQKKGRAPRKGRALCKMGFLALIGLAVSVGWLRWLDGDALDALKHHLDITTIILLVVIINLMSFVAFVAAYAAWRWVRRDWTLPPAPADHSAADS